MASDVTADTAARLWVHESSTYRVLFRDQPIGSYTVELSPDADGERLGLTAVYEDAEVRTRAELFLRRDTLLPLSTNKEIRSPQGTVNISATYGDEALELQARTPAGPQQLQVPLVERVFDNESLLMIIRGLPLADGYRGNLEVAKVDNGRTYFAWVERIGQQPADGPDGPVDCHHVRLTFENAESHEMWYSLDPSHALICYDNRSVIFTLAELSSRHA